MVPHRLLSADAQKGVLVTHSDSKNNALGCQGLLDMESMHVSLALPCLSCMGREQIPSMK